MGAVDPPVAAAARILKSAEAWPTTPNSCDWQKWLRRSARSSIPTISKFLNPPEMPKAIVPRSAGRRISPRRATKANSRAASWRASRWKYATVVEALEEITGQWMEAIHIVGGGSRNGLLNQFTADACARKVVAGPVEATVLGNVLVQARAAGELRSLDDIRRITWSSSDVQEFFSCGTAAPGRMPARTILRGSSPRVRREMTGRRAIRN